MNSYVRIACDNRMVWGNPSALQPVRTDKPSKRQFLNMLDHVTWLYEKGRRREIPAYMQELSRLSWEWFHFRVDPPARISGEWK